MRYERDLNEDEIRLLMDDDKAFFNMEMEKIYQYIMKHMLKKNLRRHTRG